MDFSKLESGQVKIEPRDVDPSLVLRDALSLLEPQARAKGLTLNFISHGALPLRVTMDDARVRQILLNLIGNAVKFTEVGSATLTAHYSTPSGCLRCEVVDTGAGIPADQRDRLFKRFSQLDASSTRAFDGTGLGLAICKGLVEAMGGAIGVISEAGQGSCFWFDLPCPETAPPPIADFKAVYSGHQVFSGLRVLVAANDHGNLEFIGALLRASEIQVTEVEDGESMVARAMIEPFDVILTELHLSNSEGQSAALTIREGGGPNDLTPILAIVTNTLEQMSKFEVAASIDGLVSPANLLSAIAHWASPQAVSSFENFLDD